jgi:O-antigen/teichoic acid export membrane protein
VVEKIRSSTNTRTETTTGMTIDNQPRLAGTPRTGKGPLPNLFVEGLSVYLDGHWMSLLGDFTWTLFGNGIFAACQWGIIIILAKMVNAEAIGQYSLAQAILTPALTLTAFQLRGVVASDVRNEFTNREYFGFRSSTLVIGFLAALAVAFSTVRSSGQFQVVGIVGLIQCAELFSDTLYGFHQRRGNLARPAVSMIMKGLLGLLGLIAGIYWGHSALIGLSVLLATRAAILVLYDLNHTLGDHDPALEGRRYFDWYRHFRLFKVVCYVGIMAMFSAWIGMIPRYFVEAYLGSHQLGVFTAIYSLTAIGLMPVAALGVASFVRLARTFNYGPSEQFFQLLGMLLGLSLVIGIGGLLLAYFAGPQILSILFRPEYAAYGDLLKLTMMIGAVTFLSASLGASLTAARVFKPQVKLLAIVGVTEALACWVLVPRMGLNGAAIACLVAAVLQFLGTALVLVMQWVHRIPVTEAAAANSAG